MVAAGDDPWSQHSPTRSATETSDVKETRKRSGGGWRGAFSSKFSRFHGEKTIAGGLHQEASQPAVHGRNGRDFLKKYSRIRAGICSVTVVKPDKDSKWGFGILQDDKDLEVVRIKAMTNEGLLQKTPFREGDILKTVNNSKCLNDDAIIKKLVNYEGGIPITLIAETPDGNPKLVQAMARKPNSEARFGIGFYNIGHEGASLLIINHLAPTGLLAYSSLSQGDLVISINGIPCSRMISEEAAELVQTSGSTIDILALRSAALHEELNPSFSQRLAKRAIWAAGALFTGGPSGAASGMVSPENLIARDGLSQVPSFDAFENAVALTRTESGSSNTGRGSRASHRRSVSHEEIALSMMSDSENMDDTISELSFTENDQDLSAGFSDDIEDELSTEYMEDVLVA